MECWDSDVIQDSIFILSTLGPAQSNHLGKIVLEVSSVGGWKKDGRAGNAMDWEGLDTVLSKLANDSVRMRGKRLKFILVVVERLGHGKFLPTVRKWLPKLLSRFNELGLLHVHRLRGGHCRAVDDSCLCHDKSDCLREDF